MITLTQFLEQFYRFIVVLFNDEGFILCMVLLTIAEYWLVFRPAMRKRHERELAMLAAHKQEDETRIKAGKKPREPWEIALSAMIKDGHEQLKKRTPY